MKKVVAILSAAAAVLGSAINVAPANAVTAELPVEIKVEPYIYLRTYKSLKFVVNQQELGGKSMDENAPDYNEASPVPLSTTAPDTSTVLGSGKMVVKKVDPLYLVWGAPGTTVNVNVNPIAPALKGTGAFPVTATMSVKSGNTQNLTLSPSTPQKGTVELQFDFDSTPTAGSYTGGKLTISATTP
jgi:hypothetical protein